MKLSNKYVKEIFGFAKEKVIEQAKTEFDGKTKKINVDKAVIEFIKSKIKPANPVASALINILVEYVPVLTQCIYENLKKYVDGLTEA